MSSTCCKLQQRRLNADWPTELAACSAVQEALLLARAQDHKEVQLCGRVHAAGSGGPKISVAACTGRRVSVQRDGCSESVWAGSEACVPGCCNNGGRSKRQVLGWLMCRPKMLNWNEAKRLEKKDIRLGQRLDQTVYSGVIFAPCARQPPFLLLLFLSATCSNSTWGSLPSARLACCTAIQHLMLLW